MEIETPDFAVLDQAAVATPTDLRLVIGACIASGVSHLGSSTMPFQISALIDRFHISASSAGMFGFFEILSLSIAMVAMLPLLRRLSYGRRAVLGAALISIGHVLIYVGPPWLPWLWGCAIVGGTGYGIIFSAFIAGASGADNPDRVYSLACGGGLIVLVGTIMTLPWGAALFGPLGPFLSIAAVSCLLAPFLSYLGDTVPPSFREAAGGRDSLGWGAFLLLAMWTGYSVGSSIVWSFADNIGRAIHVPEGVIVTLSSVGIVLGFFANMLGAAIAGRVNRVVPLVAGILGTGLSCMLTALAWNTASYCAGVVLYWIFVMIAYAYLLGAAAVLDRGGRVGTLGGGCDRIAYAIGAPIGGLIVDHGSYHMLGFAGVLSCIMLVPACMPAIARALRQSDARLSFARG